MKNTYIAEPKTKDSFYAIQFTGKNLTGVCDFIEHVGVKVECVDQSLSTKDIPVLLLENGQLLDLIENNYYLLDSSYKNTAIVGMSDSRFKKLFEARSKLILTKKEQLPFKKAVIEAHKKIDLKRVLNELLGSAYYYKEGICEVISQYITDSGCTPYIVRQYSFPSDISKYSSVCRDLKYEHWTRYAYYHKYGYGTSDQFENLQLQCMQDINRLLIEKLESGELEVGASSGPYDGLRVDTYFINEDD